MKIYMIILFLLINTIGIFSQTNLEIKNIQNSLSDTVEATKDYEFAQTSSNEVEFLLSHLFLFYKNFISSQDISTCSFIPTCSEYALKAIKKQGVIMGGINFFDRYTRCNGLSPEDYSVDKKEHKLIDPVRNFSYDKLYKEK